MKLGKLLLKGKRKDLVFVNQEFVNEVNHNLKLNLFMINTFKSCAYNNSINPPRMSFEKLMENSIQNLASL